MVWSLSRLLCEAVLLVCRMWNSSLEGVKPHHYEETWRARCRKAAHGVNTYIRMWPPGSHLNNQRKSSDKQGEGKDEVGCGRAGEEVVLRCEAARTFSGHSTYTSLTTVFVQSGFNLSAAGEQTSAIKCSRPRNRKILFQTVYTHYTIHYVYEKSV